MSLFNSQDPLDQIREQAEATRAAIGRVLGEVEDWRPAGLQGLHRVKRHRYTTKPHGLRKAERRGTVSKLRRRRRNARKRLMTHQQRDAVVAAAWKETK
jgi:hypothetical protein